MHCGVIHKKSIITLIVAILLSPVLIYFVAYADEDTSATYSTPLLPNITDYTVDTGNDVTLDVNVAEINALEITLSTSNLVIDLTPRVNAASFGNDTLSILVGTSNSTGYTLTMSSIYNGNSTTSLTRTESINNTNPTIETIETAITPDLFSSSSDTTAVNRWGCLLSTTTLDVDKTVYNPVLTTNTINSSTEAVSNDPTTLTFGAKVDNTIPAGDYRTTLRLIAVVNPINTTIKFNGNGATAGTMADLVIEPDATTTLTTGSFTKANATFTGWNTASDGTGDFYRDAGSYTASDNLGEVTLYAMWNTCNPSATDINNTLCMQDINSTVKSGMEVATASGNAQYQLFDNRDWKKYWVAKLLTASTNPRAQQDTNGNYYQVWMTQNLDLDLSTSVALTHANTDLGWTNLDTSATWTPSSETTGSAPSNQNYPRSVNLGDVYYYTSGSTSNDMYYASLSACIAANHTENDCTHYHAGNSYNWAAAVANNNVSSITGNYILAPNSICPANWRLPTGMTASKGYTDGNYLLIGLGYTNSYGGISVKLTPIGDAFNEVRIAPFYLSRSAEGVGGTYWSNMHGERNYTAYTSHGMSNYNGLYLTAGNDNYQDSFNLVRCVAR